ncbi:DUF1292 domain-containing protein [Ferviditalea candida]|uniref:DUF1292 domain-containing protein n=1 Tax=Ferviditalea candida TaxID=3108399 RepID=A0ABU5ZIB8_9BACL|nr:DUF1292 domain-containing protein [Paenibacillaceae bacterium T2]
MTVTGFSRKDLKPSSLVRDEYGEDIVLFDEGKESSVYRLLSEFGLEDRIYAVMQSDELAEQDEVAIFRVLRNENGELQLESIEDDDEWEDVAELYDEMTFADHLNE